MKGNPKVVESLQTAAALEAQLAAQYHLDKLDLKFYGLRGLAEKFNEFGEDAERWLKKASNRILELGGRPSYSAGAVQARDGMGAILAGAIDSETALIAAYNEAGPAARAANDNGTGHRIDHLVKYHEAHVEYLERMAAQLADLGDKGFKGAYVAEK